MNAWSRTKNGNRAYDLVRTILTECTLPNLWDSHPPFQIDGNFGATAGIAEMLIQSHEGYIHILPALPDAWSNGSFNGLTARGGFTVSAKWENKRITEITVTSKLDSKLKIFVGEGYYSDFAQNGYIDYNINANKTMIFRF